MKSFKKILAVTLVTAIAFVVLCVPAFAADPSIKAGFYEYYGMGVLNPSPVYPDTSTLPYGENTLVYDLIQKANNGLVVKRFYLHNSVGYAPFDNFDKGLTVVLTYSSTLYFHFLVISPQYPIFYEEMYYLDSDEWQTCYSGGPRELDYYTDHNGIKLYSWNLYGTMSPYEGDNFNLITYPLYYRHCSSNSSSYYFNGNALTSDNINSIPQELWDALDFKDIWVVKPTYRSYPTTALRDEMMNAELKDSIDNLNTSMNSGFDSIVENNNTNTQAIQDSVKSAAEEISVNVGYNISNMRDSLLNAGGDIEGIDTDTSWMDDSVTKINEWLSELQDFEKQLSQNEVENSENMQQASYFLNGFFDNIPTVITAVCGLCLVMIVVVKVVGR